MAAKRSDRTLIDVDETGIMGRLALACYSAWFYLIKTLWSTDLHAFPMRPQPLDWTQAHTCWACLGLFWSPSASIGVVAITRVGWLPGWLILYFWLQCPAWSPTGNR